MFVYKASFALSQEWSIIVLSISIKPSFLIVLTDSGIVGNGFKTLISETVMTSLKHVGNDHNGETFIRPVL